MAQDLLWITQPRRATCLATVTQVKAHRFQVDRALFAPRSRACRHPQQADQGTVWWEGEKRWLQGVEERADGVWYALRGAVPPVGASLQCQLDQDVRAANDRAHTAMHLIIKALADAGGPPMTADPEIKGGGHMRITLARPPGDALDAGLRQARAWIDADLPVTRSFIPRSRAERIVTPQAFQPPDPIPGPDVLPVVEVGKVCAYPCDGTHVDRTGRIGALRVAHARPGKDGFVVGVRVE